MKQKEVTMGHAPHRIKRTQIAALLLCTGTAGKIFYLPSLMSGDIGRDFWIAGVLLTLLEWLLFLSVYIVLRKNPDKTLYQLLSERLGGVFAKIIMCFAALFFVSKMLFLICEGFEFSSYVSVMNVSFWVYALPLLSVLGFAAFKGLRNIGRSAGLFFPFIILAAIVVLACALPNAEWINIAPIGVEGEGKLFATLLKYGAWFSDAALMLLTLGSTGEEQTRRADKHGGAMLLTASIIHAALLCGFYILFAAAVGANTPEQPFALERMSQFMNIINIFGRVDRVMIAVWSFGAFLKITLCIYAAHNCVTQAFNIKTQKTQIIVLAAVLLSAFVLGLVLPAGFISKTLPATAPFVAASLIVSVGLPLMLFFSGMAKKKVAAKKLKRAEEKQ